MSDSLSDKDILLIQKSYLGNLFIPLTEYDVKILDSLFDRKIKTRYFRGSKEYLKKTAAYFLLSKGKMLDYRYITASEILGVWLGKEFSGNNEDTFHLDLYSQILIIHNLPYGAPNKSLETLICQQVSERSNRGLVTIILDEDNLKELKDAMRSLNLYVHEKIIDFEFKTKNGK